MSKPARAHIWMFLAILATVALVGSVVVMYLPKLPPDESAVGMSKKQIREAFREPDDITFTADLPSVVFVFDEKQQLKTVEQSTWLPLPEGEATTPMDFEAFPNADPDEQHRMLMSLVRDADRGRLPVELRSLEDVEARFPSVSFLERWHYAAGFAQSGWDLFFNKAGICIDANEDFF